MRFLHTSDWHVGKTLKGRSRHDEHRAVLTQIVDAAIDHEVDAVLIAGDLYETAAPGPASQKLVNDALLRLARAGIEVVAITGNHDNPGLFEAYRNVLRTAGVHVSGQVRPLPHGVHTFTARSTGEPVRVALIPFLARRKVVRAIDIVTETPAQAVGRYEDAVRQIIQALTAGFRPDAVNIVLAHLTCTGGRMGGGERQAQSIFEYHVPAAAFGVAAHYVALGHLHRRQRLDAPAPVHYSGSPLAVDFGEEENSPVVCLVQAHPAVPVTVTDVPITAGRRLRTITGTSTEILDRATEFGDDYLRLVLREPTRAGLRDELLAHLPNALELRIHPDFIAERTQVPIDHATRTPAELFAAYCAERNVADDRVAALFADLADQTAAD